MFWAELKRLVLNRRWLSTLLAIVALVAVINWQRGSATISRNTTRLDTYAEFQINCNLLVPQAQTAWLKTEIERAKPVAPTESNLPVVFDIDRAQRRSTLDEIKTQVDYLADYQAKSLEAIKRSELFEKFGELFRAGGVKHIVVQRVANDLKATSDVKPMMGNYLAFQRLANTPILIVFPLLALLFALFTLPRWKERRLNHIVVSCKRGRLQLSIVRAGVLLIASLIAVLLCKSAYFGIDLIRYGGLANLSAPIQSVPDFFAYPLHFSVFTYLLVRVLFDAIMVWFFMIITWCFITRIKQLVIAIMAVIAILVASAWVFYTYTPGLALYGLRAVTVFGWFESNASSPLLNYIVLFGVPVHKTILSFIVAFVLASTSFVLILSVKVYQAKVKSYRLWDDLKHQISSLCARTTFTATLYKVLICNCGILILAVFCGLNLFYNQEPTHWFSEETQRKSYIYQQIEGDFTPNTFEHLTEYKNILAEQEAKPETDASSKKWYQEQMRAVDVVEAELHAWQQTYPNEVKRIVDPLPVLEHWGEVAQERQTTWLFQSFTAVVLMVAMVYRHEEVFARRSLLQTTKFGRRRFVFERRLAVAVLVIVIWCIGEVGQHLALMRAGIAGVDKTAQLHAVAEFINISVLQTFGGFSIFLMVVRLLGLLTVATLTLALSELGKMSYTTVMATMIALIGIVYLGAVGTQSEMIKGAWLLLPFGQTGLIIKERLSWGHLLGLPSVALATVLAVASMRLWQKPNRSIFRKSK